MSARPVTVFFYGSYMNPEVLADVSLRPTRFEPAVLVGYEISIQPLANLRPKPGASTFGIVAEATHAELSRLYAPAEHVLGGVYLPEAVLVRLLDRAGAGLFEPALCYISSSLQPGPARSDYVDRILGPAQRHGFPDWYLARLVSFKSA